MPIRKFQKEKNQERNAYNINFIKYCPNVAFNKFLYKSIMIHLHVPNQRWNYVKLENLF